MAARAFICRGRDGSSVSARQSSLEDCVIEVTITCYLFPLRCSRRSIIPSLRVGFDSDVSVSVSVFTETANNASFSSHSWWRSIVVTPPVSAGELSLSCARLMAGRVTTLWVKRPLLVNQHGQLSQPSLRGRLNE